MPNQHTAITPELVEAMRRDRAAGKPVEDIAHKYGLSRATVSKYAPAVRDSRTAASLPDPAPEAGGPSLPDPVAMSHEPLRVTAPGRWLVLSDVHIPYHDPHTIRVAVEDARRAGAVGVLLNGDLLDCYQLSAYCREPDKLRFKDEVEKGRQFLAWVRSQFPRGRVVLKEGNHEERLARYIAERAPELWGLEGFDLPSLLQAADHGVEWVGEKRAVHLGRLPVLHGHEFRGGGGVNPARWLFLKTVGTALCGHFHRTSEHFEPSLDRRLHGVWSVGCACYLHPKYDPNNKWNHGWAVVDIQADGHGFSVTNRRVLGDGRVV